MRILPSAVSSTRCAATAGLQTYRQSFSSPDRFSSPTRVLACSEKPSACAQFRPWGLGCTGPLPTASRLPGVDCREQVRLLGGPATELAGYDCAVRLRGRLLHRRFTKVVGCAGSVVLCLLDDVRADVCHGIG